MNLPLWAWGAILGTLLGVVAFLSSPTTEGIAVLIGSPITGVAVGLAAGAVRKAFAYGERQYRRTLPDDELDDSVDESN